MAGIADKECLRLAGPIDIIRFLTFGTFYSSRKRELVEQHQQEFWAWNEDFLGAFESYEDYSYTPSVLTTLLRRCGLLDVCATRGYQIFEMFAGRYNSLEKVIKTLFKDEINQSIFSVDGIAAVFCNKYGKGPNNKHKSFFNRAFWYGLLHLLLSVALNGVTVTSSHKSRLAKARVFAATLKWMCASSLLGGWAGAFQAAGSESVSEESNGILFLMAFFCANYGQQFDVASFPFTSSDGDGRQWTMTNHTVLGCTKPSDDLIPRYQKTAESRRLGLAMRNHFLLTRLSLNFRVNVSNNFIEVKIWVSRFYCYVIPLLSEMRMKECGMNRKTPFPSAFEIKISAHKDSENDIIAVLPSKPTEMSSVADFCYHFSDSFSSPLFFCRGSRKSSVDCLPCWKYEQMCPDSITGIFSGVLSDLRSGEKIVSGEPSQNLGLFQRITSAEFPCCDRGKAAKGLSVKDSEAKEPLTWMLQRSAMGKIVKWVVTVQAWTTFPSQRRDTFGSRETRQLQFARSFGLNLVSA